MRNERGFALITALAIAVLYFALMELMLIDSLRSLQEAQRFKSRVVALTLAESGAELAAENMVHRFRAIANDQDSQGTYSGQLDRTGSTFELRGTGATAGVARQTATVRLTGRLNGNEVIIDYSIHSQ